MAAAREPGLPLLLICGTDEPKPYADADAIARRLHDLRRGQGLRVTSGHASTGGPYFPGVLIWLASGAYLAFSAGPGVDTPVALLAALARTRTPAPGAA
jgi:hypothetical protein